jgi:tetratricopeptide (TPR) repeat protein
LDYGAHGVQCRNTINCHQAPFRGLCSLEKDIIDTHPNPAGLATAGSVLEPRRKIILRDSVTLLVLVLSTLALYAITSFLFQSFLARRVALGQEFAVSGQRALTRGDAEQAINDLRVSLAYAPDETSTQLLLAEALERAHHPAEAQAYFLNLLEEEPADGFLNLQLARLARQQRDTRSAIRYYRAAAVGNWNGDSLDERFHAQLELADYLLDVGDSRSARAELLVAAADAPPQDAMASTMIGQRFERTGDLSQALKYYKKALKLNSKDAEALAGARRVMEKIGEASPTEDTTQ